MHSSKHQHRHCGLLQSGHMCTSTTMPNHPASSLVNHELQHALDERKLTNEYKTGICWLTCHERTTYLSLPSFQITGQIKENCMKITYSTTSKPTEPYKSAFFRRRQQLKQPCSSTKDTARFLQNIRVGDVKYLVWKLGVFNCVGVGPPIRAKGIL